MEEKTNKISLMTLLKIVFLLIVFILLICNIVYWRKYNENKEVSKKEVKNEVNNEGNKWQWTIKMDKPTGRNLYALYWEGIGTKVYNYLKPEEGFVIEGENIAEFLEEKLEILGLNDREKEEFIVYWLPQMEKNKYNYIRFETKEEIEAEMPLGIEPKPDTVIRVLMDWKALDEKIEVKEQKLEKTEREGYTVVEWGGSELKENIVR